MRVSALATESYNRLSPFGHEVGFDPDEDGSWESHCEKSGNM